MHRTRSAVRTGLCLVALSLLLPLPVEAQPSVNGRLPLPNGVPLGDYGGLVFMIGLLVTHMILLAIVQYSHTYLSGWIGQTIIKDIRIKLYQHLLKLRLKFFDKTPIGRFVTSTCFVIERKTARDWNLPYI